MNANELRIGDKIIAIFMNGKLIEVEDVECVDFRNSKGGILNRCDVLKLKYHTSWDWQVPAWSKIAKLIKKIADDGSEWDYKVYMGLIGRYENAIFNNVPIEGFVVITDAIHFYNTQNKVNPTTSL